MVTRKLVATAAMALMALAGCGGETSGSRAAADPLSPAAAAGKALFDGNCAACHGDDLGGRTGPALGPGSNAAEQPDDELLGAIGRGGNGMPAWGGVLDESQIGSLLAFLRESQG